MLFPQDIVNRYVNEYPFFCPYCGEEGIVAGDVDVEFNYAWQKVGCTVCKKQWHDVFKLVDIEEIG